MSDDEIKQLLAKLEDHEKRIVVLESGLTKEAYRSGGIIKKTITLPELIRGKNFKSGQEKLAVIVGYLEKISHKEAINEADIKTGWKEGKFNGKYNPNFLSRAIKDGLVRKIDGSFDLSQSGETFFNNFQNADVGKG